MANGKRNQDQAASKAEFSSVRFSSVQFGSIQLKRPLNKPAARSTCPPADYKFNANWLPAAKIYGWLTSKTLAAQ